MEIQDSPLWRYAKCSTRWRSGALEEGCEEIREATMEAEVVEEAGAGVRVLKPLPRNEALEW